MKAAFHTLGCKVNQYETEALAAMFAERGFEIVGERDWADVYIVNTCTVTAEADRKSRQYIRRMKRVNPDSLVAVTGCYSQVSPHAVAAVEGVDIVTGTNEKHTLIAYVEEALAKKDGAKILHVRDYENLKEFHEMKADAGPAADRTRAYIKVQEGCDRFCTYCVVPYARGPVRSRAPEDIMQEAKSLLNAGYKEIVLTGINTALYGIGEADGFGETGIEPVIAKINKMEGDFRIRLSSLEPTVINHEYVKKLFKYDKLCHHLHISAQSGSDSVLEAMNRKYTREEYEAILAVLKDFDSCYGVSTDIIAGFPGEKEADFEESLKLINDNGFCKTHIFRYSERPGTAAAEMKNQISHKVRERRARELEKAARKAAQDFFENNLIQGRSGRTERVLIEERLENMAVGYTGNYIRTYIPIEETGEEMNKFITVRLIDIFRDGMTGTVV